MEDIVFPPSDLWRMSHPLPQRCSLRLSKLLVAPWNDFYASGNLTIYYTRARSRDSGPLFAAPNAKAGHGQSHLIVEILSDTAATRVSATLPHSARLDYTGLTETQRFI